MTIEMALTIAFTSALLLACLLHWRLDQRKKRAAVERFAFREKGRLAARKAFQKAA